MTIPAISEMALQSLLSALADVNSYVFLESTKVTPENHHSLLFLEPQGRLICGADDDPGDFFKQAQEQLDQGFFLAGYLGYEFGYLLEPSLANCLNERPLSTQSSGQLPLADLGVFRKPHIFDHQTSSFIGAGPWPTTDQKSANADTYAINNLRLSQEKEDYLQAIDRVKSYIAAGDTYQVNYTLKLLFEFSGSIAKLYSTLRRNQSVSYGGIIKNNNSTILTFSPELFFRKQGETISVRPMKGTMHRGRSISEDQENADFLHHDIKNRSENVMIVDLLRNDLGRLSRMGGVSVQSLFDVETYETLLQMTSSIKGQVGTISLEEMFRALFPCGSVTGAPKIRTMEIIRELETEDRGIYTGAIGYLTPGGESIFNVPIRTVVLQNGSGEMGIGSGIVWDSDPADEWDESILKGRFLTRPVPEFKLIETMLWNQETGYWLLDLHLERLAGSAGYFFYPFDLKKINDALRELAKEFQKNLPIRNQRVRLTLSKQGEHDLTSSELPDGPFPEINPSTIIDLKEPQDLPGVIFSSRNTDSYSPYLFHKTTLRKLYDNERTRAVARGCYEVLFMNEKGEVTEGSFTNIFLLKEGRLLTPPVSCGLLPGILRTHLLAGYPEIVKEANLSFDDLKKGEAVYVGNSVRGLVRVKLISE